MPYHVEHGRAYGNARRGAARELQADVDAGRSIEDLGYLPRRRDCYYRVIEGTEADPPRKPEFALAAK